MLIYEYEAKQLFRKHQIPLLNSVLITNPEDIEEYQALYGNNGVIKAQILSGGRGKRGLIKVSKNASELKQFTNEIFQRTDVKEGKIQKILIEEFADIADEIYLSAMLDRTTKKILVMISLQGGVNIEKVAEKSPHAIAKDWLAIDTHAQPYELYELLNSMGIKGKKKSILAQILSKIVHILHKEDLMMLEINPFVFTKAGKPLALDARVLIDPSALYRHPDQAKFKSLHLRLNENEEKANENGLAYVQLSGEIGLISCGAGLSMASCDMINHFGGSPANFLDVGGGASPAKVEAALDILFSQEEIKGILINVFGGITRCDQVAEGIVLSVKNNAHNIPIVVRLIGTNDKMGVEILSEANLNAFTDMEPAVQKIVELSK